MTYRLAFKYFTTNICPEWNRCQSRLFYGRHSLADARKKTNAHQKPSSLSLGRKRERSGSWEVVASDGIVVLTTDSADLPKLNGEVDD